MVNRVSSSGRTSVGTASACSADSTLGRASSWVGVDGVSAGEAMSERERLKRAVNRKNFKKYLRVDWNPALQKSFNVFN
ncbi:hypothetical protein D3C72_1756140 [compost metagenome]